MFTGLVEEIGKVMDIKRGRESLKIKIGCKKVTSDAKSGDSIATNGVCLTAVEVGNGYFVADAMPETVNRSNLKFLKRGDNVNLEKSITLSTPLGGHLVTGDVDCIGEIISVEKNDIAILYKIKMSSKYMKYIVEKGRVSIDGASLTVVECDENSFVVSLIPHTQGNIILGSKKGGDTVNIETDLIGKYVEKLLSGYLGNKEVVDKSKIGIKFLMENGFA